MSKNNKNNFLWKQLLKSLFIFFIFLTPFIYTIVNYYFFSSYDDYFIKHLTLFFDNWKLFLWLLLLFIVAKWSSFWSILQNIGSLFFSHKLLENVSEHNDGYLSDEDFGKEVFAHNILQIINNFHNDTLRTKNLVIGLDGKWGDGKTYVIKKIKKIINNGKFPNFHLISFQPWMFAKNTNYTNSFIDKLNSELIKLKSGISIFYASAFKEILDNSCGFWGKFISFFTNKSDEELKDIIQNKINQTQKQFIIVIDDLDRLDNEEILQIFKLVRCVANFDNLYFLICLDRELVEYKINETMLSNEYDNIKYCDKIVNMYFEIPPLSPYQLNSYMNKLIHNDSELKQWKDESEKCYGVDYAKKIIKKYIPQNIRDVKIVLNKLKALSQITYTTVESTEDCKPLAEITNFYNFLALEMIKKQDLNMYYNIKKALLSSTIDQMVKNPFKDTDIQEFILHLSMNPYKYFIYNSGDRLLSDSDYEECKKQIKNNISYVGFLYNERTLNSFFEKMCEDINIDKSFFNKIVQVSIDNDYQTEHFNKFFEKYIELLDVKKILVDEMQNKEIVFTLINKSENKNKRNEFIEEYVKIFYKQQILLPANNLIFYIDFNNYTPELFGILCYKLLKENIRFSQGLWHLLEKLMYQSNNDISSLFDKDIILKHCKNITHFINKLKEDSKLASECEKNAQNNKLSEEDTTDNYYNTVKIAYDMLINFLSNNQ